MGLFKLDPYKKPEEQESLYGDICRDPEHNFPPHLHVPEGYGHRHVCPSCGNEQVVVNRGFES